MHRLSCTFVICRHHEKTCLMPYANNKDTSVHSDQLLCCSLPGQYNIYRCLTQNYKILASFCSWAGWFESYPVTNPQRQVFSWRGLFDKGERGDEKVGIWHFIGFMNIREVPEISAWHHYFYLHFYTPPHKKWRGIMLYPPNFKVPSIWHPSVCPSTLHFRALTLVLFALFSSNCIDIGIGEGWYGIASGLISFWNNRVMALDVCQKCFALRFRALTSVPFYQFSSNFA